MVFVVKGLLFMKTIKSIWLQRLVYKLCLKVVFLYSRKVFVEKVIPTLVNYLLITCTFQIWVSRHAHNVFVAIINSLKWLKRKTCHYWPIWGDKTPMQQLLFQNCSNFWTSFWWLKWLLLMWMMKSPTCKLV
jgi:hypothetical protein